MNQAVERVRSSKTAIQGCDSVSIVLTCEHGGNTIPPAYRALFFGAERILESHRGWDPGALRVAKAMSKMLGVKLFSSTTSRLLVELNRSLGHRSLFSEFTANLPAAEQHQIIDKYWHPYRDEVTTRIDSLVNAGRQVIHFSVHSFTPVWEGTPRKTSIGLLYDPRRPIERSLCESWKARLRDAQPEYSIHSNQPYRGIADGFTTSLRRRYDTETCPKGQYNGIEVEINQALVHPATARQIHSIAALLSQCLISSRPGQ
jgi:predicted N-formylglutamate amidohydrolase